MSKEFVHLHLHTDYSLLDGAIKIAPLAKRAAELKMSAMAITDHGNLFGSLSFYNKMKGEGVKPIIGIEAYIAKGSRLDRGGGDTQPGEKATNHIVLLAKNLQGYHNLIKLSSYSYIEGFWRKPRIDKEILAKHSEGLIGLSACISGVPPYLLLQDKFDQAGQEAISFRDIFGEGNYYLEIQEHGLDAQKRIRKPMVELSKKTGIPLVATNDSHYLMPDDVKAHEMLLCIGRNRSYDPKFLTYGAPSFYVKSAEEMWQVFGEEPDLLLRTLEIAEKCDLTFPKTIDQVPVYPVPEDHTIDSYFEKVTWDGFEERLQEVWRHLEASGSMRHSLEKYKERLGHEIATIKRMGYSGYFLIVWDFIRYAKRKGIPVGPGRGSAAGSLVAYCLKITDVDPIQYDLLFERFLNPERVTMPDIDVDFCVRGRGEVINYVSDLYGRQNVCQIITFGTMASRAVIKDVGRAMGMDYKEVEKVAKMIPPPVRGRNVSIEAAIEQNPELKTAINADERVAELIDTARKLEGNARHSSVHAAGVVISPKPIYELIPVCTGQNDELTTQFVMSDLEKTGMLKMDFLALTTLTIIDDCLKTVKKEFGEAPNLAEIPLTDGPALKLFADGLLNAVFQFESSGMVEICRKLKPESLEDLSALNALYRPGPLDGGMVDDYIERRHGRRKVQYIAPQMKEILENTYGILVYQEQIMQLAQKLAGYSLGEADLMRRAMGKKKKEEMALHETKFIAGAVERGITEDKARKIFHLMAQFADYGFNRSHSFAYAYLAYQTAYLKAHYPAHFFAAVLSNEITNTEKVARYIGEMKSFGIELLPPDVNTSDEGFTPSGKSILFGLAAIKGIGSSAVQTIIRAREQGGAFKSIFDFADRVDQKGVNKRVLESLIKAGAFDVIQKNRAALLAVVDRAIEQGARAQRDRASGQGGLFSMLDPGPGASAVVEDIPLPNVTPWTRKESLSYEKEALGLYASGHPLEEYAKSIQALTRIDSGNIAESAAHGDTIGMGGMVIELAIRTTKKGDRFALFRLEDQFGSVKVVCWPETFNRYKNLISDDQVLLVRGKLELSDEGEATIIAAEMQQLDAARTNAARGVLVQIPECAVSVQGIETLCDLLSRAQGTASVFIEVGLEDGLTVRLRPQQFLRVKVSDELLAGIQAIDQQWKVNMIMGE